MESTHNTSDKKELTQVMLFLSNSGFRHTTYKVTESIAKLIVKSMHDEMNSIGQAYAELAGQKTNGNAYRAQLTYYVQNNYEDVRNRILNKHNYDIGDNYGVKNFIEQMAIAYNIFADD